jgi:hypothetical protein
MTTTVDTAAEAAYAQALLDLADRHRRQQFELALDQLHQCANVARALQPSQLAHWEQQIADLIETYRLTVAALADADRGEGDDTDVIRLPCGSPAADQFIGTCDRLGVQAATTDAAATIWCRTHRTYEVLTPEEFEVLSAIRR